MFGLIRRLKDANTVACLNFADRLSHKEGQPLIAFELVQFLEHSIGQNDVILCRYVNF
jgi:hypothetical protein